MPHGDTLFFSVHWEFLRQRNVETQGFRFATSTRANVVSQIRQWIFFCIYFEINPLPASAYDISLFLELLARTSGYGHVKNALGGIGYLHHTTGHCFPSESIWLVDTLKGVKRSLKGTPKQVIPIDLRVKV